MFNPDECPLCGADLEFNQVFYVCEGCFTPFNPGELEQVYLNQARESAELVGDQIIVEKKNKVATVIINRPEQRNAISLNMWHRFKYLFEELDGDSDIRLVVLRGQGSISFSAGADIKEFEQTRATPQQARHYRQAFDSACDALYNLNKPSIAVIQGHCFGGGFELALCADLRISSESASFAIPAAKMGLAIPHSFVSKIASISGHGNAAYMLLTSMSITSEDAHRTGLVNVVIETNELEDYLKDLTVQILSLSPNSHSIHKQVLRDIENFGAPANVPSSRLNAPRRATENPDFHEGVRAFLEKRKPDFGLTEK